MSHSVVVVPCYNEQERLNVASFEQFVSRWQGVDFLLVDDGSRDATLELLKGMQARNPRRFGVLHLEQNSGKAEAVRRGCLQALEARPAYIGYWDADLATPLEDIIRFANVLEQMPTIEAVVGCRIRLLGRTIERRAIRRLLGRVFAKTASLALRLRIYDTQCGAKLFRTTNAFRQTIAVPFLTRWLFDVEILARLTIARQRTHQTKLGQAIYEQPLDHWRDVAGSKLTSGDFIKAINEMARIYFRYLGPAARWMPPALSAESTETRRAA